MKTKNRYLILLSVFTIIILLVVILIIAGQGSDNSVTSSQPGSLPSTQESSVAPVSSDPATSDPSEPPVSSQPSSEPSSAVPTETLNYDSDVFAFAYPGSWVASTANDTVILIIPDSGNASVKLTTKTITSDLVDLDTARGLVEAQFKSNYPDATVTSELTKVGERNTAKIEVSGTLTENSGEIRMTQYVLGFGTRYVYVMYTAEPDRYDTYIAEVENIVANFTLK